MPGSLRRRLPRIGRVPRLLAAGVCLLLALASAAGSADQRRRPATSVPVVVAARDLPAGATLTAKDLTVARWPPGTVPAGAQPEPAAFLGRRAAGPVVAREPITATRLVGAALTRGLPAGTVAAPVVLDDPHAADVVHAGDRVTVLETPRPDDAGLSASAAPARVGTVATRVRALAVLPAAADGPGEVIVAVDESTAVRITRDRVTQMFTLVVEPP
jgi:pilus assembly protein CpaB